MLISISILAEKMVLCIFAKNAISLLFDLIEKNEALITNNTRKIVACFLIALWQEHRIEKLRMENLRTPKRFYFGEKTIKQNAHAIPFSIMQKIAA